jgi:hypothetical protein
MKFHVIFLVTFFISSTGFSQASDFIVFKKNHRTVKSFFSGSPIDFQTAYRSYSGQITLVARDTIFVNEYDIRQVPTNLGVYVLDTIATYKVKVDYKEIIAIGTTAGKGFSMSASGASLLGGGILITTVGLGTWIFTKPGTQYHASPYLIAAGAAAAGLGYLLLRSKSVNSKIGKKYTLEYIKTK